MFWEWEEHRGKGRECSIAERWRCEMLRDREALGEGVAAHYE